MNFRQYLVLSLLAMITISSGHIGGGQITFQNLKPQVYCGRNLARMLAALCYDEDTEKRSETGTMYNSILTPYYKEQEFPSGWPWISPHKAQSISRMSNRGKRYIVDECCSKACSIAELLPYC